MKKTLLVITLAMLPVFATAKSIIDSHAFEHRTLLFSGPDSISKFYRIPALATMPDGTLVAAADRRRESNKDLPGKIDIVCRRSHDNGNTWTDATVIAHHNDDGGYGDPSLAYDPKTGDMVCVMTHGEGLWEAHEGSYSRICISRSSDGGATWSTPTDITAMLYSQNAGEAPLMAISSFATSGRILVTRDGDLWFVLITRHKTKLWSELANYVCHSSDGGFTWEAIPVCIDDDADESKLVELADGRLLMSIRNRRKGYRKFAFSDDRGKSWTAPAKSTTLPDPACNGDIIALDDGTLIHSINDSHTDRTKVSLFASRDMGMTWTKLAEVCPVWSAYSAISPIDNNRIGILSEEGNSDGGLRIWFTRLNLDKLLCDNSL